MYRGGLVVLGVALLLSGCSTKKFVTVEQAKKRTSKERHYTLKELQSDYVHFLRKKRSVSISKSRRDFLRECNSDFKEIDNYKRSLDKKAKDFIKKKKSKNLPVGDDGRWGKNRLDSVDRYTRGASSSTSTKTSSPDYSQTNYSGTTGASVVYKKKCQGKKVVKEIEVDDKFLEVPLKDSSLRNYY